MRLFVSLLILGFLYGVAFSAPLDGLDGQLQTRTIRMAGESAEVAFAGDDSSDGRTKDARVIPGPDAELETLLAQIRQLAPGIESPDIPPAGELTGDGEAADVDRKDRLVLERQMDVRRRLSQAIAQVQAGQFQPARQSLEAIYRDYPYWMKTVYFTILCHRGEKHNGRALAIARELIDRLQCRVTRQALEDSLEVELETWAGSTGETALSAEQRKKLAGKLDELFARVKKLRPDLAELPLKRKKPVPEGESHSFFLRRMIRFYNAREVRAALGSAGKEMEAGKTAAAFERYAAAYEEHPGSLRSLYGMAVSSRRNGDLRESVRIARNLLGRLRVRKDSKEERRELDEAMGLEEKKPGGDKPGNNGEKGTADTGGGSEFRIASFNIFHGTDKEWEARLFRSTKVLLDNRVDIAGLQEVRENQMKRFMKADLGGHRYAIYPPRFKGRKEGFVSENSIIWNKERFELVSSKEIPFMYFSNVKRKLPQLKLRDRTTGQVFYVLNTHDPAFPENAAKRLQNANFYAQYLDNLAKEGLPIFFTGDFNSGYKLRTSGNTTFGNTRKNLTYCILTRSGKFWDAWDASRNKRGEGPSTDNANSVDHIFMSSNVQVTKYFKSEDGKKKNGSDVHDTIIAQVKIPE